MSLHTNHPCPDRIDYKPWLVVTILMLSDITSLFLAFFIPYLVRKAFIPLLGGPVIFSQISPLLWISTGFTILLFISRGLYPGDLRTGVVELKEVCTSITFAYIALGVTFFLFGIGTQISRFIFLISWLFACMFVFLARVFIHNRFSLFSWWSKPTVIVGALQDVPDTIACLQYARRLAIKPVAILTSAETSKTREFKNIPVYSNSLEKQQSLRKSGIKTAVYISQSKESTENQRELIHNLSLTFPKLIYVLADTPLNTLSMRPLDLDGRPALQVQYNLLSRSSTITKRILDLTICILFFFVISPLLLLLSLLVRLDSPGPAIYTQERMGKDGRIFKIYKFRTMIIDADLKLAEILKTNETMRKEYQRFHKLKDDPRITRTGRFLRKTSLDELPQLWNVLRGEMSLVGPRAYLPGELEDMGEYARIIRRIAPGLTGWWQVMGRQTVDFNTRLVMDEYYISNFSLWMDLFIIIKTFWIILIKKGA